MSTPNDKEESAKREIAKRPGKEDVHEQREHGQKQQGVVTNVPPPPKETPPPKRP